MFIAFGYLYYIFKIFGRVYIYADYISPLLQAGSQSLSQNQCNLHLINFTVTIIIMDTWRLFHDLPSSDSGMDTEDYNVTTNI